MSVMVVAISLITLLAGKISGRAVQIALALVLMAAGVKVLV